MELKAADRTVRAVAAQVAAMGASVFEIGLFKPDASIGEPVMLPRVWDAEALLRSVPWLRQQNVNGRNVFIRPKGEHGLSLVDDLPAAAIARMQNAGFAPALVVETSRSNFQAWVKHSEPLDRATGTAAAQALAHKFGGDTKAADWRHFGRLAGLTNRKMKHLDVSTGLYPFVKLIEATGAIYPEAIRFVSQIRTELAERQREQDQVRRFAPRRHEGTAIKPIEVFRADPRYGDDGTRVDLAFAVYALSRGASAADVESAIRSRDLSHKGNDRRQQDYISRTIQKALSALERGCGR